MVVDQTVRQINDDAVVTDAYWFRVASQLAIYPPGGEGGLRLSRNSQRLLPLLRPDIRRNLR